MCAAHVRECVCVCVCVRARALASATDCEERERARPRERVKCGKGLSEAEETKETKFRVKRDLVVSKGREVCVGRYS